MNKRSKGHVVCVAAIQHLHVDLHARVLLGVADSMERSGSPARRLAVIQGHLNGRTEVHPNVCGATGSSAPISSSKAEVQKAFPRRRYACRSRFRVHGRCTGSVAILSL